MQIMANLLVGVVAVIHIYILILEMFLWTKPMGLRAFGLGQELAEKTKVLAANQGLYNGFLAAGLCWGLSQGPSGFGVKIFFLLCILTAGIFGALTANKKILWIQALPALVALALVLIAS